jgi:hypothetical protein
VQFERPRKMTPHQPEEALRRLANGGRRRSYRPQLQRRSHHHWKAVG